MAEAPTYRFELEQILSFFGNKRVLSVSDVAAYTGRSRLWCRNHLGVNENGCTVVQLATALTKLPKKKIEFSA